MSLSKALRKTLLVTLRMPALTFGVMRHVAPALCRPWRPPGLDWEKGPHSDSLAYAGFSGRFSATIVTLFVGRALVQASLPPKLTIVGDDQLPDWLRGRDEHPVILLIGKQVSLGRRKPHFGMLQTFPLFRPYLRPFLYTTREYLRR